eukprot:3770912-Rhodomonas_salina.1
MNNNSTIPLSLGYAASASSTLHKGNVKKEWITWTVSSRTYSRERPAQLDSPQFHVDKSTSNIQVT